MLLAAAFIRVRMYLRSDSVAGGVEGFESCDCGGLSILAAVEFVRPTFGTARGPAVGGRPGGWRTNDACGPITIDELDRSPLSRICRLGESDG